MMVNGYVVFVRVSCACCRHLTDSRVRLNLVPFGIRGTTAVCSQLLYLIASLLTIPEGQPFDLDILHAIAFQVGDPDKAKVIDSNDARASFKAVA